MKRGIAILLSILIVSLPCVCLGQGEPPETVDITLWTILGGTNGEVLENVVQGFNETIGAQKGIKVTPVYQGNSALANLKPIVQVADVANMPDVITVGNGDTVYMKDLEYLVWLEDLIRDDPTFSKADIFEPNIAETFSYQGRMLGAPSAISAITLYYNKNMFRAAGLDPESPPDTLAKLAEYTEKLTTYNSDGTVDVYGFACTPDRWHVSNWIGGQGEYTFVGNNESGRAAPMTELVFGENGSMAKFLTEYGKIVATGGLQPLAQDQREEFLAGQYAMIVQSSSRISQFVNNGSFDMGVARFPRVSAQDKGGVAPGGQALYILNRGDQAKTAAAYEFVKYMVSPEASFAFSSRTGYVPVNKNVYEMDAFKELVAKTPEFLVPIQSLLESDIHVQEPMDPNPNELGTIFKEQIAGFVEGSMDVNEAVEEMVVLGNEAMELYYRANPIQ